MHDPISFRLRERLRELRRDKGWSIYDLSRAAGVSPSFISMVENGHKAPDPETLRRIADALGMDPELSRAWMTLRDRSAEPLETIQAASAIRDFVGDAGLRAEEPRVAYSAGPPRRFERDRGIPIPLFEEGTSPAYKGVSKEDPLLLDRRALPVKTDLDGAFAWRLTREGVARVRGEYRRGDYVVIAPGAWTPEPAALAPPRVFAVRIGGRGILSRVTWGGGQLILLPAEGGTDYLVRPAADEAAVRKRILGRVVAGLRKFPER